MLLRIFLFCLLLGLVYRILRDVLRSSLRWVWRRKGGSRSHGKKPSWDVNKNRIRDAEFRDLDG